MLVPALVLSAALSTAVLLSYRMRKRHKLRPLPAPAKFIPAPHFDKIERAMPSLEEAHAPAFGALALNMPGTTRIRPGHRSVEEIRKRTNDDFAGALNFLEGQLDRRISDNPLEQSRYWTDLAEGLRNLNLNEALPVLLRRADNALDLPLAEGFAAELVSFAGFADYLHEPTSKEGQSALRVLRVAMEAARLGRIPATIHAEAAFGDAIRRLSENYPDFVNPRLVLVFIEAMRHCRRQFHTASVFREDPMRRQTVRWQHAFLRDAEPIMREYLHDIDAELIGLLAIASRRERLEILQALAELHSDTDDFLLSMLGEEDFMDPIAAIKCLKWSKSRQVSMALCTIARQALTGTRTAKWLQKIGINRDAVDTAVVIETLNALSGHPCAETERVLLQFAQRPEPELRKAAIQSLGWWEPIHRDEILGIIRVARLDEKSEIRKAALAAAARLGECAAIQTIRETLIRQHPVPVLDAIRICGSEGLTWLWPDLDALTESDDPNIANEAWEIIEQLRERFMGIVS